MTEKTIRNIALIILVGIAWYLNDFKTAIFALIGGVVAGYFALAIYNMIAKIFKI